jgi:hypothetical protein
MSTRGDDDDRDAVDDLRADRAAATDRSAQVFGG